MPTISRVAWRENAHSQYRSQTQRTEKYINHSRKMFILWMKLYILCDATKMQKVSFSHSESVSEVICFPLVKFKIYENFFSTICVCVCVRVFDLSFLLVVFGLRFHLVSHSCFGMFKLASFITHEQQCSYCNQIFTQPPPIACWAK